jgi:transcriptional regulator with XRE-family HTH domain
LLLLDLRTRTGETQKQLAKRLAMTECMISRLERGDHVPSLATLCRLADAFGRRLEIATRVQDALVRGITPDGISA